MSKVALMLTNYDDSAVVAQLATISQTLADLASSLDGVATNEDLRYLKYTRRYRNQL